MIFRLFRYPCPQVFAYVLLVGVARVFSIAILSPTDPGVVACPLLLLSLLLRFIATEDSAAYITGQTFTVDGGMAIGA